MKEQKPSYMKLEQYKIKKNYSKLIVVTLAVLLIIGGIMIGRSFASFKENKSFKVMEGNFIYEGNDDIIFEFYNKDQELDEMPKKDNPDNLKFEKSECDNKASIEWNNEKWAPLVTNLTTTKTKCKLYFVQRIGISLSDDIPLAKNGQNGLYAVEHNNLTSLDISWNKTEYRYAGGNPNNYVSFNNEIWRIIGLVNVKTKMGVEQRIKIIRANGINNQKNFGNYAWYNGSFNNWVESETKEMLNGAYYNSERGRCWRGNSANSTAYSQNCDFSGSDNFIPKGLNEDARKMIDSEVIWNVGANENKYGHGVTAEMFYESERGTITSSDIYPYEWTKENDSNYHNGIGLMYMSDYGYATHGGTVGRENCLNMELQEWDYRTNTSECPNNDWLKGDLWTLSISILSYSVFYIESIGYFHDSQANIAYGILPAAYLTNKTIIYDGDGSLGNPFKLKIVS